ncbi:MAG: hypothetical protein ACYS67_07075 [Planctomycetota bacterium]|jgi:hypothetical protein
MKKSLLVLLLFVVWLTGCIFVVKEEKTHPPKPDIIYVPADGTIEEIDVISKLSFESDRLNGYKRIAARQELSDEAQDYLVQAIFDKLSFESSKEVALMTLIENPYFSSAGRHAILSRLERLHFENSKTRILKAINERREIRG